MSRLWPCLALMAVCAGCSAEASEEGAFPPLAFAPSAEALPLVEHAVEQWGAATGIYAIADGAGGIPVLLVDELLNEDGSEACGHTQVVRASGSGAFNASITS